MNMRNTNAGGFPESRMLQHLNTNIMKLLPDELLDVITPRHSPQWNNHLAACLPKTKE